MQNTSFFLRQVRALGATGHSWLRKACVAVIGLGGVGSHSALLLAQSGVRELRLVDRDLVEESNLSRTCLFGGSDVGKPKAEAAATFLSRYFPHVEGIPLFAQFSSSTVRLLLEGVDLVLDCSDNHSTREAINEVCWQRSIPWVYAGAQGFRVMASAIVPRRTPCFACWSLPRTGESCSLVGVMNTAVAVASSVQVQSAVDLISQGRSSLEKKLFFADLKKGVFVTKPLSNNLSCAVCGIKRIT